MRKTILGKRRRQQIAKEQARQLEFPPVPEISSLSPVEDDRNFESQGESGSDNDEDRDVGSENEDVSFLSADNEVQPPERQQIPSLQQRSVLEELKLWGVNLNVNNQQFSALLKILKRHHCFEKFPSDCRSLLLARDKPKIQPLPPEKGGISFEVFPEKWLHGEGLCYWPKSDQQKAIRLQRDPDKSWNLFPIEAVLGKYDTFDKALKKVKIAVEKSDLESEAEEEMTRLRQRSTDLFKSVVTAQAPPPRNSLLPPPFPSLILADGSGITGACSPSSSDSEVVDHDLRDNRDGVMHSSLNELMRPSVEQMRADSGCRELIGAPDNDIPFLLMAIIKKQWYALIINLGQDLKLVKLSITNLENKLDRLRLAGAAKAGKPYLDPLKSPLTSMESFTDYDAGLEGEKYDFKVIKLKDCGGLSVTDAVGRMMKKIMSNELGTKISLKGMKNNFNFSSTQFIKCVREACLLISDINATEQNVEHAVGEWLRHSGDRLKTETTRKK
ncbi:hypothetical protein Fcan01_22340 [Folsomia candida]|uniref:DUF4806 domain-containing protein n=1 Tax=Folsomia candida TaxID=158441 RepID=A0A226DDH1_FOLCA|nr:hypothetical protein Fcan01_22340 [Folsomia candida]